MKIDAFDCRVEGQFAHPSDCSKFVHCSKGIAHIKSCGLGTWYNADQQICIYPEQSGCQLSGRPVTQPPIRRSTISPYRERPYYPSRASVYRTTTAPSRFGGCLQGGERCTRNSECCGIYICLAGNRRCGSLLQSNPTYLNDLGL